MHHHLEIIMPPTSDVKSAINQIMTPFDENPELCSKEHQTTLCPGDQVAA